MKKRSLVLFMSLSIVLAFQACSNNAVFSFADDLSKEKSQQNGDAYTGKPDPYNFVAADQKCTELGANGQPLPNAQVFLFPSGYAQLVRENCADITPKNLLPGEFSITASGDVLYQGLVYANNSNAGDFDVVAASCPSGKTMLANPLRENIIKSSQDPVVAPWFHRSPGVSVPFIGSLGSLPAYKVEVTDPAAAQGWTGLSQTVGPNLLASETYVVSFFVKPDPVQKMEFAAYATNKHDFRIQFDLTSGAALVQSTTGVNFLGTQSKLLYGGFFISVYFQLQIASGSNLGFHVVDQSLGSAITATAFQMEQVSKFCSP